MERKEYQNRQEAPLVNPPITNGEYEKRKKEVEAEEQDDFLKDETYYVTGC